MALIVDASVAINGSSMKRVSRAARHLLDADPELLAPELLLPEVCSAVWRKARLGHIEPKHAQEVARRMACGGVVQLRSHAPLGERSMEIALTHDHPIYVASMSLSRRLNGARW